jgi:hypothetical protein
LASTITSAGSSSTGSGSLNTGSSSRISSRSAAGSDSIASTNEQSTGDAVIITSELVFGEFVGVRVKLLPSQNGRRERTHTYILRPCSDKYLLYIVHIEPDRHDTIPLFSHGPEPYIGFGTPRLTPGSPSPGITSGARFSIAVLPIGKNLVIA